MIQKYIPEFLTYDTPQRVPTNCNSITFINLGESTILIENVTLLPTQSLEISGNACEYTDVTILLNFTGSGQNNCTVIKKRYLDNNPNN